MKYTTITCSYCNEKSEKQKNEIDRQKRNGNKKFYCNRMCVGLGRYVDKFTGFRKYITNSRHKNINKYKCDSNLTLQYLKRLWNNQNGLCVLTGVELTHKNDNKHYQASLDRINSYKGYVKGNVQFISVSSNWLKNIYGNDFVLEYHDIVKKIAV